METKDIILELRTKKGLSQEELAEKIFVTRQAISRWENGETIPNTETLKLLSKEFDVSINTLLGSPRNLVCQCCGMPLEDTNISKEPDGFFNEEYCKWCYADGEYTYDNMDDLIDFCVGELVKLNISDIDFDNRECIVFGKGSKERPVYFDARTKIHLRNYVQSRTDDNPALFVSLLKPYNRLEISGVEIRMRQLGRMLGIDKVHPHKFRRTLATRAIDKGMPIEQVQQLLGHAKIDTTMQYAMVSQNNVKLSHRKYIG